MLRLYKYAKMDNGRNGLGRIEGIIFSSVYLFSVLRVVHSHSVHATVFLFLSSVTKENESKYPSSYIGVFRAVNSVSSLLGRHACPVSHNRWSLMISSTLVNCYFHAGLPDQAHLPGYLTAFNRHSRRWTPISSGFKLFFKISTPTTTYLQQSFTLLLKSNTDSSVVEVVVWEES